MSDWITSSVGALKERCAICGGVVEVFSQARFVDHRGELLGKRIERFVASCRGCDLVSRPCDRQADVYEHFVAASVAMQLTGGTPSSLLLVIYRAYSASGITMLEAKLEELREA